MTTTTKHPTAAPTLIEARAQAKREIIARLTQLAEVAASVGMTTLARDLRVARIPKVENERFYLVVLGEFNHGKSTFVNALLGAEVLPTGITPTTAAINHVVWSPHVRAQVTLADSQKIDLAPGAINEWVTVAGGRAQDVAFVELGYPAEILQGNVTLIDTPGVNDLNEQRAEITYGYVPRADAVLFLLDAGQALKDSEREFLASHVLEGSRDRMIFVLGKMDMLNAAERTAVIDYVHKGLAKLVPDPVVFPLSAREWLLRRDPTSGMPELIAHLSGFLATDRAQLLLDNAAADAGRTAAYLQQNLGVRLNAYALDLVDLEERIVQVRTQLDSSKRKLDELHVRISADCNAIKTQVHLDLDAFARSFVAALPEQIDAVDANDVKRYLPGFIEDRFRSWAELEGAKLAARLEQVAEEVISVTNENVAAAAAALADRLGPDDTEVQIEVDSFKYDVGIYAVGALGTTVFLFVNTLAGGLLTLAAPILAIVLKSKVAGDIREQAKAKIPAAIIKASDAMGPHFDRCIDDFAKRLSDFVANAGNTLYKGISEILDRTMADRRERGGEVAGLRADTEQMITAVIATRAALTQLREGLWRDGPPGVSGRSDMADESADGGAPAADDDDDLEPDLD